MQWCEESSRCDRSLKGGLGFWSRRRKGYSRGGSSGSARDRYKGLSSSFSISFSVYIIVFVYYITGLLYIILGWQA